MDRANNNIDNNTISEKPVSVKATPVQGPCDACGNPIVPSKPTPNQNRPKRKTDNDDNLIYTNGVQKVDNVVSVKVTLSDVITGVPESDQREGIAGTQPVPNAE